MAGWRTDTIAGATLLVAILSCPLVYFWLGGPDPTDDIENREGIIDAPDRVNAERILETVRKARDEEHIRAIRAQALRFHEERIGLRRTQIADLREEIVSDQSKWYADIDVSNDCRKGKMYVAIHYKDLLGDWVTTGWWGAEPGETVHTNVTTSNSVIYYSANIGSEVQWQGKGQQDSIVKTVTYEAFYHVQGEQFIYDDTRQVSFLKKNIISARGRTSQGFTCE
jgi:uncharacterized membrane protein